MGVSIGDKVRKIARRNHRGSAQLGIVVELLMIDGKEWVRIASGAKQEMTTVWPVRQLKKIEEET